MQRVMQVLLELEIVSLDANQHTPLCQRHCHSSEVGKEELNMLPVLMTKLTFAAESDKSDEAPSEM